MINGISQEPRTKNKGIIRAEYAKDLAQLPISIASIGIMGKMKKLGTLSNQDSIQIRKSLSQALTDTGLKEKGTKAIFIKPFQKTSIKKTIEYIGNSIVNQVPKKDRKAYSALNQEIMSQFQKSKIGKKITDKMGKDILQNSTKVQAAGLLSIFKNASNACYLPNTNTIIVPENKLVTSAFHEMGHALNANFSKFGKFLQKNRKTAMLSASAISLIAMTTKKKADDETPTKGIEKVTHFVKKNAAPLTLLSMVPVILEEGLASFKGNKIAAQMLDKKLLNKVKMTNAFGLATYILGAVGMAIGTKVAVNVKDSIQEKHEVKAMKKFQAKQAKLAAKQATKSEA